MQTIAAQITLPSIINDNMVLQQNFEAPIWGWAEPTEKVKNSDYPNIRLFQVEKSTSDTRQDNLPGTWTVCGPETMKTFSGTGYFFGRELHKKLTVPIGLINASWGGTAAEVWTDEEVINGVPELLENSSKLQAYDWWPIKSGSAFNAMIAPITSFSVAGVTWLNPICSIPKDYLHQLFVPMIGR